MKNIYKPTKRLARKTIQETMRRENRNNFRLDQLEQTSVFLVPEEYFRQLPNRILAKSLENNQLLRHSVFQVPTSYFDLLTSRIQNRTKRTFLPLNAAVKTSVFQSPPDYFKALIRDVEKKTKVVQENPLQAPSHYFDTLSDRIIEKTKKEEKEIRVDFRQDWGRYAIAASVAFVIALTSLYYFLSSPTEIKLTDAQGTVSLALIASLDKSEINNYLERQEIETHDLVEASSQKTQQKLKKDMELLITNQKLQPELNDLNMTEMPSDI